MAEEKAAEEEAAEEEVVAEEEAAEDKEGDNMIINYIVYSNKYHLKH